MARRGPDPPVRNLREDRNNPGVSGTQGNSPGVTRGGRQVEDVINQMNANPFYCPMRSTANRGNGAGVSRPNEPQDRSEGRGEDGDTTDGSNESSDEPDRGIGWRSRVRDFLSCSRLVNVVKATIVIVTLITSLALILVQITSPHPDFDALVSQSALVSRLENQVLILGERLKSREAVVSSLEDAVSTLKEQVQNRSAFINRQENNINNLDKRLEAVVSSQEDTVFILKEHINNQSAFTSRQENNISTIEKRLDNGSALANHLVEHYNLTDNRSTLVGHLKNGVSTGEEGSELAHVLEIRVWALEAFENQTALIGALRNKLSAGEDRVDSLQATFKDHLENSSALDNLLENRVSTLEKHLENSSMLDNHLKNEVSTLKEDLENRMALVSRLEDQISSHNHLHEQRKLRFSRLEDQVSTLGERLENGTALVSRLEGQISSHNHLHEQRKALFSRLEDKVSTLEERLENRTAQVSRLGGQVSTLKKHLKTRSAPIRSHVSIIKTQLTRKGSALVSRLEGQVSTLTERLDSHSTLVGRLEGQVSTLEKHLKTRSALVIRLEGQLSTFKKRLDTRSSLVSRLEAQVTTLEEHFKTRTALISRLEGQVSTLEKRFDSREELSSQPALENRRDKKQTIHVHETRLQQTDLTVDRCSKPGHVFHLESPDGKYRYGFDEAREACAGKGAVLASLDQLFEDQPDGFWLCKCGWISDARSGLVMHNARADCLNKTGFHQCTRGTTWNAWCFCLPGTQRNEQEQGQK